MKNLLSIKDLSREDVEQVFELARELKLGYQPKIRGTTCAFSFEGNSVRTRVTFLRSIADLKLTAIELPNLLKTREEKVHLAGYLDQWVDMYVIRESDHAILERFAHASQRPVINAMSSLGHPCEILSDALFLKEHFGNLEQLKVCIVGPLTNVLRSWREFCELFGMDYVQVMPKIVVSQDEKVTRSLTEGIRHANIILTDTWPEGNFDLAYQVTMSELELAAGDALVIPCPPFDTTREVHPDVIASSHFAGYGQKRDLYYVHKAIMVHLFMKN